MKIAKYGRFFSLLALLLVASVMLTMISCTKEEPEQPDNVATEPSDQLGETTAPIDGESTDLGDGESTDLIGGDSTDTDTGDTGVNDTTAPPEDSTKVPHSTKPSTSKATTTATVGSSASAQPTQTTQENPENQDSTATKPTTALDGEKTTAVSTEPIEGDVTANPTTASTVTPVTKPSANPNKPNITTAPTDTKPSVPGTRPPQSTTTVTTTTTQPTLPPDNENVLKLVPDDLAGTKIKMMLWWNSGNDEQLESAAMMEETGIEVSYETVSLDKYQQNLVSKIMSDNSPTLAALISDWYPQPITRGLMQPLSNVEGWNFKDEDLYSLSMMDQFGYKGQHYSVAMKGSNMTTFEVMFFNKDILKQQGVDKDPYQLWKEGNWNWDTCLELAIKCTDDDKGLKGITNTSQYYWMLSAGQDFVVSDPENGLKNNLKNSELVDAWYWNWDLINTYKVIDTTYTSSVPFYQGKAAMFGTGSFYMQMGSSYVYQNMKNADWGVVPFPSPKGMSVAACEGITWGFPVKVSGKELQAAAWYLRYSLDDYHYGDRSIYPKEECWEVMGWMWDQQIQSYNSVGVLTYGGEYTAWSIQYTLVDDADTKAKMQSNLDTWYSVLDTNIKKIETELD